MSRVCEAEGMVGFDEVTHYASSVRKRERFMDRPFVRRIARLCPDGGSVLDVGTGPGHMPIRLAALRPDLAVHGVDLSPDMLATARRAADEAGVADCVAFRQGDAKTLPYPDHAFDMVVSHVMLHHADDPAVMLSEMMRVLKPGGRLLLKDICRTPDWTIAPTARILGAFIGYTPEETRLYDESIRSAFTLGEIRAHVERLPALRHARVRRSQGLWFTIECVKEAG